MNIAPLFLVPILVVTSGLVMYRYTGRRQIMKLDLVQFVYTFIVAPLMYLWMKGFLVVILKNQLGGLLTLTELFIIEGVFTVVFVYVYAFVVLHALTKTFDLNLDRDPLYDIVEHAEYFHQLLSHIAFYIGALALGSILSITNAFLPLAWNVTQTALRFGLLAGGLVGVIAFIIVWSYETDTRHFYRLMKLAISLFFVLHVAVYFLLDLTFSTPHILYWFFFASFFAASALAVFAEKPEADTRWKKLPFQLNWRLPHRYLRQVSRILIRQK